MEEKDNQKNKEGECIDIRPDTRICDQCGKKRECRIFYRDIMTYYRYILDYPDLYENALVRREFLRVCCYQCYEYDIVENDGKSMRNFQMATLDLHE